MEFEWDENKRAEVAREHGVDLVEAILIFEGHRLTWRDNRRDYGEVREISIGMADGVCLVVVHTVRDEVVRLITAWKGGRREQRKYQESLARRGPENEG
jgi:uncharacterized DUF497 family protein